MAAILRQIGIILLLMAGAFYFGYKKGQGNVITVTKEIKGETRVIYKDRIVTVTKIIRPDGTVEETTRTEDKSGSTTEKNSEKDIARTLARNVYSLGLITSPHVEKDGLSVKRVKLLPGVTAGYSPGKDVWLKIGAIPSDNIYIMGVEIQF